MHIQSTLSPNRLLSRTDTWCWSLPFFSHFTVTKLSIRNRSMNESLLLAAGSGTLILIFTSNHNAKLLFVILSSCSSSGSIYCFAFRPRSRERLLYEWTFDQFDSTRRKWFHFSATIYVPVLDVLYNLNWTDHAAHRPLGPGLQMFGLITLSLVINRLI